MKVIKKFICSSLLLLVLVFFNPAPVLSQEQPFVVADIIPDGLQRVAHTAFFSMININVGDEITQAQVSNLIRDVMASGFFANVEVIREGNILVIRVDERPSISSIEMEGNRLIPEDSLRQNLAQANIVVGEIFAPSVLDAIEQSLIAQYISRGRYGARVEIEVEELERNRVALSFNFTEGDPAKIVHMNIIGNEAFSNEQLLNVFELRERQWWRFFNSDDEYARERIDGDLERLTSYYNDRGYVNFAITSVQVALSPDMEEVYITINVDEGDIYHISEVTLAGNPAGMEGLLRNIAQIREGQVFSQQLITSIAESMVQVLGLQGYFFANVDAVPIVDEEQGTVEVTFFIEPGERTYVNRISFTGNVNTLDAVLRREMRQMEGAPASRIFMEQSLVQLERLGFFSEVDYDTEEVPGVSDQINVNFTVSEQLSGQIGGSIGYAQAQGLVLSANVQDNNFLGSGNFVGLGVNHSRFATSYSFNYNNPYYTIDGVSRGFGLSYTKSDYARLNLASFTTNQMNANVNFGYPIGNTQRLQFGFNYSYTQIDIGIGPVQEIKFTPELFPDVTDYIVQPGRFAPFLNENTGVTYPISEPVIAPISQLPGSAFQEGQGFIDVEGNRFHDVITTVGWLRSTLNRGLFPTAGSMQNLSFEFAIPGSDLLFYRLRFATDNYIPLRNDWILRLRGDLGYGDGYGGSEQLPFFRNFYAGGLGSIRGFDRNTLGPRSTPGRDYELNFTRLLRDENGDLVLDSTGNARFDTTSDLAYVLAQARDADGNLLVDPDSGFPIYEERLNTRPTFGVNFSQAFGGNIQTVGSASLLFPLPFIEDRSRFRSSVFVDGGNVFSSYCSDSAVAAGRCTNFSVSEMRYSAGVSFEWFSGFMGIMTFSFAKPFNAGPLDERESFQFTIGNTF